MRIIVAGGSGQVGEILVRAFRTRGHEVKVLSRGGGAGSVPWDGKTLGEWAREIDGCDIVVNLAGRSVNCRYTRKNLRAMMDSRVESTRVLGEAIAQAARPPRLWLQMSTATIYAHSFEQANDEATGIIGGHEAGVPAYWGYSIEIARAWEKALLDAPTPRTRKVALRSAMVMSPARGGIFATLLRMARTGLGGAVGGGGQFVSWIHEADFIRAIDLLITREDIEGAVNLAAPNPLTQKEFMRALRLEAHVRVGLPATKWMAEIGAFVLRTDTELLLKSRKVVPGRLLQNGFTFNYADWPCAAHDLVERSATGET